MRNLKFWAAVAFTLGISMEISKNLVFNSNGNTMVSNPFAQPMPYIFNTLGIYFGIAGIILWLGRIMPISNSTMAFSLIIG